VVRREKTKGGRENKEDQQAQTAALAVVFLPPVGFLFTLLVNAVIEGVVFGKNVVVAVVCRGRRRAWWLSALINPDIFRRQLRRHIVNFHTFCFFKKHGEKNFVHPGLETFPFFLFYR